MKVILASMYIVQLPTSVFKENQLDFFLPDSIFFQIHSGAKMCAHSVIFILTCSVLRLSVTSTNKTFLVTNFVRQLMLKTLIILMNHESIIEKTYYVNLVPHTYGKYV